MCDICSSESAILGYLIISAFILALIIYVVSKKKFLSTLIFSVFINGIFISAVFLRSLLFQIYGVEWLQYFSIFIWPIINIILIFYYVRKKNQ